VNEPNSNSAASRIEIRDLTMAFDSFVLMRNINARIRKGEIFIIMGGSGCGKSTLLRHMVGLKSPAKGDIYYDGEPFWGGEEVNREKRLRSFGVLFQGGALWSALTLIENVGLPLGEFTDLALADIEEIARLKLSLVGLKGFEDYYPSQISGGMCKRAGLARALALDPEVLFFDEPSAGLDPISSRRLDDLILQLRDSLGATFVVVTHELQSIFAIADDSIFLDPVSRTMLVQGNPRELLKSSPDPRVREFLTRGESTAASKSSLEPTAAKT
jgi:phospholipid/cholesterol/gamma-HCH transport system ATP-binding protein